MTGSSPERVWIRLPCYERGGGFSALFERRGTRDADPDARRVMPRYHSASEFRMAPSRGMVRRHCLRPGKEHDEQNDERPCRDDATPSAGLRVASCLRFGFDAFEHAITPTCCTAADKQRQSSRQAACGMAAMPSRRREDGNHSDEVPPVRSGEADKLFGARPGRIAELYAVTRPLGGRV
jgi:hypothetical protein